MSVFALALTAGLAATSTVPASQTVKSSEKGPQGPVLRLDVRRVPVDVVVTDKDGKPVRGLNSDDFTIKKDGKKQHISSFGYEDGSVPSFTPAKLPPLPANTFVNEPTEPEIGPLYVLYYDMVNTSMGDQMSAHKQLLDLVDKAPAGTRFALFINAAGLHLVQGFTSDHALLRDAITSRPPSGVHVPKVFIYGENYGWEDVGAALSNLNFLAEYLSGIPGRKNLIWLADVFPIPVSSRFRGQNNLSSAHGGPEVLDLSVLESDRIKHTYAAMMRSQIAIYPLDLGGIVGGGDSIIDHQDEGIIAHSTGGEAFYGSNRLVELADKAIAHGSSYYSLTYSPTNTKYDGSERQIEVSLGKKGKYTLTYRTLYYGVSDGDVRAEHKPGTVQARSLAAKAEDTLYVNIEHGAPMLHDLLFSAHVRAEGTQAMATVEQMAQLEDSPAFFRTRKRERPLKPPVPVKMQKYRIDYGVFDPQLKALAARKEKPATLEFAVAAYDTDGRLLNSMLNEGLASGDVGKAGNAGALFHAEQELEVPPRAEWIRIAVRDKLDNRTGTLEVHLPLRPETTSAVARTSN
jgi:VWFA-related protein